MTSFCHFCFETKFIRARVYNYLKQLSATTARAPEEHSKCFLEIRHRVNVTCWISEVSNVGWIIYIEYYWTFVLFTLLIKRMYLDIWYKINIQFFSQREISLRKIYHFCQKFCRRKGTRNSSAHRTFSAEIRYHRWQKTLQTKNNKTECCYLRSEFLRAWLSVNSGYWSARSPYYT